MRTPPPRRVDTLGQALRLFLRFPSPPAMLFAALVPGVARLALGDFTRAELWVPVIILTYWPLQEWVAHRYLQHMKPRTVLGRRFDPGFAQTHRLHHREPWRLEPTFVPLRAIAIAYVINVVFWTLVTPTLRMALTGVSLFSCMAIVYEWLHFLTHTSYRPRSRYLARVFRNHRLHHFKHEGYWFGFTVPAVDALLGTSPNPRDVERSPSVRDLGVPDDPVVEAMMEIPPER
ncbi:MAG: sterol desaturase family protein [Myxococcales bacterium]|nr:sterol desaturase family protein [Myxococcales bacterium]MCB9753665.1 sterol desaturase family protein [Myxococcales bacterium]